MTYERQERNSGYFILILSTVSTITLLAFTLQCLNEGFYNRSLGIVTFHRRTQNDMSLPSKPIKFSIAYTLISSIATLSLSSNRQTICGVDGIGRMQSRGIFIVVFCFALFMLLMVYFYANRSYSAFQRRRGGGNEGESNITKNNNFAGLVMWIRVTLLFWMIGTAWMRFDVAEWKLIFSMNIPYFFILQLVSWIDFIASLCLDIYYLLHWFCAFHSLLETLDEQPPEENISTHQV